MYPRPPAGKQTFDSGMAKPSTARAPEPPLTRRGGRDSEKPTGHPPQRPWPRPRRGRPRSRPRHHQRPFGLTAETFTEPRVTAVRRGSPVWSSRVFRIGGGAATRARPTPSATRSTSKPCGRRSCGCPDGCAAAPGRESAPRVPVSRTSGSVPRTPTRRAGSSPLAARLPARR
jgi:hypothetical protein